MKLFRIKDIPVENRKPTRSQYTKADKILIFVVLLTVGVSTVLFGSINSDIGNTVRITVDGKIYGEYDLNTNQKISVELENGYNNIVIEDGKAYMENADCPDKYCMEYAPINYGNQTIICLPHKLVVEIVNNKDKIDAFAQ